MITLILICVLATIIITFVAQQVDADIYIHPIVGLMFGALYSKEELEEDLTQYTLQSCIFFISVTVIWIQKKK
jgi:hypothetical protein|tara:strand:+ start:257 stop:475 length:219 start_codon:yes stop_codon:yes gene_type:complete